MKRNTSLKLNFIMNASLTLSSFLFPLITFPYISRILLPAGTGKVSFATSLVSYFAMAAQLGIPTYGIRACAKVRDEKEKLTRTVHELLCINVVMSVFAYLVFFALLFLVPRLSQERTLYFVVSFTIFFNAIGMEWLYKGLEEYTYITIRSLFFKCIALAAMFLLVQEQSDYVLYGGISIFAASASNVCNFFHVRRYISWKPVGHYHITRHIKAVLVFFAMAFATTIYTNLDTVMLGFMTTDTDVGYYHAAVKIKTILVGIVTSLGTVLLPRASYYVQEGRMKEFLHIGQKALHFVFLTSLPLMLYFILFAREGIFFLSGEAYAGAILPMQVIMPTLFLIGITNILGLQMLVPIGQEKMVLCSEVAGAVVDLFLNLLLIPQLHSLGAAIGTLAAELAVLLVQYAAVRKYIYMKQPFEITVKGGVFLLALALASVASFVVRWFRFGNFLTLCFSAILFFGTYALVLFVGKEPLMRELWQEIIKKFGKDRS